MELLSTLEEMEILSNIHPLIKENIEALEYDILELKTILKELYTKYKIVQKYIDKNHPYTIE